MLAHDAAPSGIAATTRLLRVLVLTALLGALLSALLGAALAPAALAQDTITLTNGNEIEGKIVEENEEAIVLEIPAGDQEGYILQTFKREKILTIERDKFSIGIDFSGQGDGLRALLGTLPQDWRSRWWTLTDEASAVGMIFLYAVTVAWFIFIPALLLHAGSSVVGVVDPTYSRAVMCIVLVSLFTIVFCWATNHLGWLVSMRLSEMNFIYMAMLAPIYLTGQMLVYKWCYVTDWQKAVLLVCIGLLVSLITGAAFLVLLSILA